MAYVTNSPKASDFSGSFKDPVEHNFKIFVLPEWIHSALTARFNLVDIHNYAKLRQAVSLRDVAALEIIRRHLFSKSGLDVSSYSIDSFLGADCRWQAFGDSPAVTEEGQQELNNTVRLLIADEGLVKATLGRLLSEGELAATQPKPVLTNVLGCVECTAGDYVPWLSGPVEGDLPYRVVLLNKNLYIRVKEGFLSHIAEKKKRIAFLSHVLKSAYGIAPLSDVNMTVWYREYVKALAAL